MSHGIYYLNFRAIQVSLLIPALFFSTPHRQSIATNVFFRPRIITKTSMLQNYHVLSQTSDTIPQEEDDEHVARSSRQSQELAEDCFSLFP